MALVGRVEMGTHLLEETFEAVPEMVLEVDNVRRISDREVKLVCWARGEADDAFEAALESDSTVLGYSRPAEVDDGPLYRITIAESDHQEWVYPVLVRNDVVVLNSTVTAEAQILPARFPSKDAVVALRDACEENGSGSACSTCTEMRPPRTTAASTASTA